MSVERHWWRDRSYGDRNTESINNRSFVGVCDSCKSINVVLVSGLEEAIWTCRPISKLILFRTNSKRPVQTIGFARDKVVRRSGSSQYRSGTISHGLIAFIARFLLWHASSISAPFLYLPFLAAFLLVYIVYNLLY